MTSQNIKALRSIFGRYVINCVQFDYDSPWWHFVNHVYSWGCTISKIYKYDRAYDNAFPIIIEYGNKSYLLLYNNDKGHGPAKVRPLLNIISFRNKLGPKSNQLNCKL